MLDTFAFAALLAVAAPPVFPASACLDVPPPADPEAYRELWEAGATMDDFLEGADRRREVWLRNWRTSAGIDPAMVERAAAVGGEWKLLAVAIAGCSDSVSTLPWLGRLAERVDGLDVRVVDSDAGRWIMEDNRTPDGRPATPTFILLGPDFEKRGCFIERPTPLQTTLIANPDGIDGQSTYEWKMAWYDEDAGASTVEEFVGILEAAARGEVVCG